MKQISNTFNFSAKPLDLLHIEEKLHGEHTASYVRENNSKDIPVTSSDLLVVRINSAHIHGSADRASINLFWFAEPHDSFSTPVEITDGMKSKDIYIDDLTRNTLFSGGPMEIRKIGISCQGRTVDVQLTAYVMTPEETGMFLKL
jgi:hypothetical protein